MDEHRRIPLNPVHNGHTAGTPHPFCQHVRMSYNDSRIALFIRGLSCKAVGRGVFLIYPRAWP